MIPLVPLNVSTTWTSSITGLTSAPTDNTFTLDTTPPSAPVADVAAASDTGPDSTDNITADTTPTQATTAPTALIPLGNLAMPTLTTALDAAGWHRITEVVYQTAAVAEEPESAAGLRAGDFSALLLRSPSAARAVASFASTTSVPVICGGPTTADAARELGLNVQAIANETTAEATAQAIFETVTSAPNRKTV